LLLFHVVSCLSSYFFWEGNMRALIGVALAVTVGSLLLVGAAVPLALALPLRPDSTSSSANPTGAVADIPPRMLTLYVRGTAWCPGLPWTVLAGIGKVETNHGRGGEVSPAGAEGPMQFMPATWAVYGLDGDGDGVANIWDAADAVPSAAHYLCANGGGNPATLSEAIWHYNHDNSYVQLVLAWAARYAAAASG
jgi:hypothetical protein